MKIKQCSSSSIKYYYYYDVVLHMSMLCTYICVQTFRQSVYAMTAKKKGREKTLTMASVRGVRPPHQSQARNSKMKEKKRTDEPGAGGFQFRISHKFMRSGDGRKTGTAAWSEEEKDEGDTFYTSGRYLYACTVLIYDGI